MKLVIIIEDSPRNYVLGLISVFLIGIMSGVSEEKHMSLLETSIVNCKFTMAECSLLLEKPSNWIAMGADNSASVPESEIEMTITWPVLICSFVI